MNSMRVKWRCLSGAASAVLVLFAALSGGCSYDCAPYACLNGAHLDGSVAIAQEVAVVDFRFCVDGTCHDGSIDLAQTNPVSGSLPRACADWGAGSVCLAETSTPETFTLSAFFNVFGEDEAPHDVTVRLELIDHMSGGVLLDEKRTAKAGTPSVDSCHFCWGAGATL
jgi:hypothetical protein